MTGRSLAATTSDSVSPLSSGQKTFFPGRTRLYDENKKKKTNPAAPPGRGKIKGYNNGDAVKQRADFRAESLERAPLRTLDENAWLRALRAKFGASKPVAKQETPASSAPTQRMTKAPSAPQTIRNASVASKPAWKTDTAPAMPSLGDGPEMTADPAAPPQKKKAAANQPYTFKESDETLKKMAQSRLKVGRQPLKSESVRSADDEKPPIGLGGPKARHQSDEDPSEKVIRDWHTKMGLPWPGAKPKPAAPAITVPQAGPGFKPSRAIVKISDVHRNQGLKA
jgi:hypothetical protein